MATTRSKTRRFERKSKTKPILFMVCIAACVGCMVLMVLLGASGSFSSIEGKWFDPDGASELEFHSDGRYAWKIDHDIWHEGKWWYEKGAYRMKQDGAGTMERAVEFNGDVFWVDMILGARVRFERE